MQISLLPQTAPLGVIADVVAYVASRRPVIAAGLRGEPTGGELIGVSEKHLRDFEKDELAFVILSVDIKGSTKLETRSSRTPVRLMQPGMPGPPGNPVA